MTIDRFEKGIKNMLNYAFPVKGKVIKSYVEGKDFYANCKKINLDDSESTIIIPKVKVPKIWGELSPGAFVNIGFYEGDIHFPFVMSVEGVSFSTPVDLRRFLEKLLDIFLKLKTVGSPANHTVSPDDIIRLTELKTIDLEKLLR